MTKRQKLSMADVDIINRIADRAVGLYTQHDVSVSRQDVLMDVSMCHLKAQKLRLDDLLAADDFNFAHDIGGINRHLDRENGTLTDGFSPRFSVRGA